MITGLSLSQRLLSIPADSAATDTRGGAIRTAMPERFPVTPDRFSQHLSRAVEKSLSSLRNTDGVFARKPDPVPPRPQRPGDDGAVPETEETDAASRRPPDKPTDTGEAAGQNVDIDDGPVAKQETEQPASPSNTDHGDATRQSAVAAESTAAMSIQAMPSHARVAADASLAVPASSDAPQPLTTPAPHQEKSSGFSLSTLPPLGILTTDSQNEGTELPVATGKSETMMGKSLLGTGAPSPLTSLTETQSPERATLSTLQPLATGDDSTMDPAAARVARALQSAWRQQGGSVTLRLDPPELGVVRIQMEVRQGMASIQFQAETDTVRTLLAQHLSSLRQTLEAQGLVVERMQVQTPVWAHAGNENNWHGRSESEGRSRGRHDSHANQRSRTAGNQEFVEALSAQSNQGS